MKHQFLFAPDDPAGQGAENTPDPDDADSGEGAPQGGTEAGPEDQGEDLVPRSEVQKVSKEAAKYRRERNALQQRIEALEQQDQSDVEKLTTKTTTLETSLREAKQENRELRVQVLASRVGIVREARSDAARLLDWDSIEDPDSEAELEGALRTLVKDKPFLLGNVPGGADGGAGGERGEGSQDMNSLLRAAAGRS